MGRPLPDARHLLAIAAAALLALAAGAAPAGADAEVYRAKHRTAEELLPLAETALAGRGTAAVDPGTNALVLVGEAPALAEALELLARQDRARRTVVLRWESRREAELRETGVRVDWTVDAGSVRIGTVRRPRDGTRVAVTPSARDARETGRTAGHLRVLDGEAGRIALGRSVPVTVREGWWESTTWVSAESGVEVHPRVLGSGKVRLALRPFEGDVDERGAVRFAGAETTVEVEPGETVALGGLTRSADRRARDAFGGADVSRAAAERLLLVTVELE